MLLFHVHYLVCVWPHTMIKPSLRDAEAQAVIAIPLPTLFPYQRTLRWLAVPHLISFPGPHPRHCHFFSFIMLIIFPPFKKFSMFYYFQQLTVIKRQSVYLSFCFLVPLAFLSPSLLPSFSSLFPFDTLLLTIPLSE